MKTAGSMLVLTLVFVAFAAVSAAAEPAKGLEDLVGKWSGWGAPMSGKGFPVEVQINPDGTYTSRVGSSSGRGVIKVQGDKFLTEGHLDGPVGVAAGTDKSQFTVGTKRGKQTISGAGRNEAGPFNYDLTKQ